MNRRTGDDDLGQRERDRNHEAEAAMLSTIRFMFERTKTPLEVMRENRQLMGRGMREIVREKQSLHVIETKLIQEIKKAAKLDQWDAVKVMTVDLIRTRHRIIRCYNLYEQLKSISLHTQTLKSTEAMAEALHGFIKVVRQLNLHVTLPALQKIMQVFEIRQMRLDMSLEEMEEDDYFEEEEEEEEVDGNEEIICQVLDEIGVDLNTSLLHATQHPQPAQLPVQNMVCEEQRIGIGLRDRMDGFRKA
ncbi:hypothetical protein R1flu_019694 [Riccia fluitans]|uniref:Uncharacterized protein n=1 Tax=Riccia fluitans TaxID=41844 RepID=A0ABD1ZKZ0_9MARC